MILSSKRKPILEFLKVLSGSRLKYKVKGLVLFPLKEQNLVQETFYAYPENQGIPGWGTASI